MAKKSDGVRLEDCKEILLEIKEEIKSLHDKFDNVDKLVAVHDQMITETDRRVNGIVDKSWLIISGLIIALIGVFFEFINGK
jgi:hypothetical protein